MPDRGHEDGEVAHAPPRRRRRAVGPPGAPAPEPGITGLLAPAEHQVPEDDDERLLRDVPPHHGG